MLYNRIWNKNALYKNTVYWVGLANLKCQK
jgi:hypothetical protein